MNEITFEIKKAVGVIKKYGSGWAKEMNIISWNDGPDKFDIREWNSEHDKMSRGITMTKEEALAVYELLEEYFMEEVEKK